MVQFKSEKNKSNLILYKKKIAIKYIERCRNKGIDILGFDVFLIYDDKCVQPFMEFSRDYSKERRNWDKAIKDIKEINSVNEYLVFEIIENINETNQIFNLSH